MRGRHNKAHRLIAGALIGSDLTEKELVEISERLMFDRSWTQRLATLLRELSHMSEFYRREADAARGFPGAEEPDGEIAEELAELFSRKRLPKAEALNILLKADKSREWKPKPNGTLRENCLALVKLQSSSNEASALVNRVAQLLGYPKDSYLRELA